MAWQLFRLGRWSFAHRRAVAAIWVLLLVVLGVGAATLSGKTSDKFELAGIESTQAFDLIEERAPQSSPDGATARVVFEAPEGRSLTEPGYSAAVTAALGALRTEHVASVTDPFTAGTLTGDGRVGYASVGYTQTSNELTDADRSALENAAHDAETAGLNVAIGGDAMNEVEMPLAEVVGIAVALLVLAVTFGSLVAAGMPLLTALVGVGIGMLAITALTGFVELSSTTPALGTMLGLAVGIDYALFIMSRYQSEVRAGRSLEEAAGRAVGTAGSAVVFAGLTVIIALVGLAVCNIGFLTQMGLGGAFTVAVAVLISLTLLPAILGFAGERVMRGKPRYLAKAANGVEPRTHGRRWVEGIAGNKWGALAGGIAIALLASLPVASMQLALPDDAGKPAGSNARTAYDLIAENFGPGANGPLVVVVDTANAADPAGAVARVTNDLQTMAGRAGTDVATVIPALTSDTPQAQQAFAQQLAVVKFATVTVIPGSGPSDQATKDLVAEIRGTVADLPAETGARALVTGQTAVGVDIANELTSVFPIYLAVVVGLAVFLLIAVFRSLWVPLKAALGFLLSVGVSLGATVAVFQWGWLNQLIGLDTTSPVLFILPILLTGILFGLAMDYEVFLVSRMREAYAHGTPARQAVIDGFAHSARVVVAAAIIMIGVFAGFALTDDVILKTIGFALAVGVLADAFLVRMLIVPAFMLIVGERIWWMPKWLAPLVPTFDIEGEGLTKRLDVPAEADEPVPALR
ncbi:MMPL family transporter [Nocardia asteroides]|uniref:MMPL family transporter n=1 Tax=Nocardia asteroides TaxID=1824 RepID=UPI001E4A501D|nr:MMPL family transporter [Nocardia asteroides]UGT61889.1 MMPL family transporter [Nocardia asteroides]